MTRSSSTPHDAEFLFRGTPYFGGSSTGSGTVVSTAKQHLGCVDVGMFRVTALETVERLTVPVSFVHVPAGRAGLRRVRGGHLDERASAPVQLVAEELHEFSPTGVGDVSGEMMVTDHATDIKPLDNHAALALGVVMREAMNEVVTLPPHLAVQAHDAYLGLLPVTGALLPPGDDALSMGKPSQRPLEMARVRDKNAVAVSDEVDDATVECDGGLGTRDRRFALDDTSNARVPLVPIAYDGTSSGPSFKRAMDDDSQDAELREVEYVVLEPPCLRMRFAGVDSIAPSAFPMRGTGELFEAALPRMVEFDEELCADVVGNIGQPRKFSAEIGQFINLVEGRWVMAVAPSVCVGHEALLMGEVPKEAQGITPPVEHGGLFDRGIEPKAESLAELHRIHFTTIGGAARCFLLALQDEVSELRVR